MRTVVSTLCAALVFYGVPAYSEPAVRSGGARSKGSDRFAAAGLERPWPPRPLGIRLIQASDELEDAHDARIAELKAERERIELLAPTIGLISGGIATAFGAGILINTGIACYFGGDIFFQDHLNGCGQSQLKRYWISGGVAAGLGLLVLATSATVYSRRISQRKSFDREILELENGPRVRASTSWSLAFEAGERKTLGLRLQF